MNKKGLGKGLKALIPSNDTKDEKKGLTEIRVNDIVRNMKQPRQEFDQEKLAELAASIKEHGVLQPIIVRQLDNGKYELVAGERRWRAAKIAGVDELPAVIKDISDREISEIALIENIQREDLNPIEEAMAFKQLLEEFGLTQEELSKRIGKSRSQIANTLRLLNLPSEARSMVQQGHLSAGHARALLAIEKASDQAALAKEIIDKGMSVRQIEQLIKKISEKKLAEKETKRKTVVNSPIISDLENQIQGKLGTKVRIRHNQNKGIIEIEYYGDEDLQRIIDTVLGQDYVS